MNKIAFFYAWCLVPAFLSAETLSISPQSWTSYVFNFSNTSPSSQSATGATWGDAYLLGFPFDATSSETSESAWNLSEIRVSPNGTTASLSSWDIGTMHITQVNDDGTPAYPDITVRLPGASGYVYSPYCFYKRSNKRYSIKIRDVKFNAPVNGRIEWTITFVPCTDNNSHLPPKVFTVTYNNPQQSLSGCDINFISNFNVAGLINHPITIQDTGLSKSKCTSPNKYSLSFSSNSSNIKIVPANNGTPVQNYTIGDLSTISNNAFPTYRVESQDAGQVKGTIQLNLTSK
ncbi:TPA: hypothetical protein SI451_000320 [Escherichia coli]|nr:hypothetical protein [Escherichia coli]